MARPRPIPVVRLRENTDTSVIAARARRTAKVPTAHLQVAYAATTLGVDRLAGQVTSVTDGGIPARRTKTGTFASAGPAR
jgi:hypothetical protein